MTKSKKNYRDFAPKYGGIEEIEQDNSLLPADIVREKVKHYSMCLFGLAADMAFHEQRVIDAEEKTKQLKAENKLLRQRLQKLKDENAQPKKQKAVLPHLTAEERKELNLNYWTQKAGYATATVKQLKQQLADLQEKYEKAVGKPTGGDNGK